MHEKNPLRVDNIDLCTDGIKDSFSMINQKNSFNQVQLVQDGKDCVDLHYLQIGQKHHPELESLSPTDKGIGTMSF